jgi:polyisoprenoid-binding protein YceI
MTTTWNIDASHSTVGFTVRHLVFSKVRGRFQQFTGVIQLDDKDGTRSWVNATIDASSIDTGTPQRDAHLRSADFFNVDAFPQLQFRSTRVEEIGTGRVRVIGDLTMRGVTRSVAMDVEHAGRGTDPYGAERIGFSAKATIDRRDFGLQWNQVLETGGVLVGDLINIQLDIQAVKAVVTDQALNTDFVDQAL